MSQADVREAQEDFAAACRHSLAHGNLLSLRYIIPDVPWQACSTSATRSADAVGTGQMTLCHFTMEP